MAELTDEQKKLFKNAFSKPVPPPSPDPAPNQPGMFGSIFKMLGPSDPAPIQTTNPDNAELTDEQKKMFHDAFNKR